MTKNTTNPYTAYELHNTKRDYSFGVRKLCVPICHNLENKFHANRTNNCTLLSRFVACSRYCQ